MAALGALSGAQARPLRVVLVTHYYPAHRGGVERIAGQLAERLASRGDIHIEWHASDCDPAPSDIPGVRAVPARSWNVTERRLGFPYPLWTPRALRRLVRACREADLVHLHDCLYLPNLVAFTATSRPVLVTQHIGDVPYRNRVLRAAQSLANRVLGRWVLGGADQVVFESEAVRQHFNRFVHFRRPALLIENGVDTERFRPAPAGERAALRASLGVPADAPLLLFLARFVEKKGLPVMRELTQRFPRAHWLFAGWGPLDPTAWARANVRVIHHPENLVDLYQAADLLLLPSVGEGFPLSVQEAMACGTPALVGAETASGCAGADGILLAEPTGAPDTVERWTARLRALLASPRTLEELRPKVAQFARERWSWERCVGAYADLFRSCARNAQRAPMKL